MSRILIISTSRETAPQPAVPLGAAWVAQALHEAGFEVRLLDLCFERDPFRAIATALTNFVPTGIGISVRNLDNCDFLSPRSFLPELKGITDFIKSRSDAPMLLGGAAVSIMPAQILEYLDLHYAVVGEGERAAAAFFNSAARDRCHIPGVVCRGAADADDNSCSAPPAIPVMPQTHKWTETARYLRLEPVLPVQGKRGCAHSCLYCTYNRIEGKSWRLRDPASVVDEISVSMRETGASEFEFVDSVFNQPEGYLETLLDEILRRNLKARFRASSLSPKGLTAAQVRLMERAGFTSVVITPETACDTTLAALGKDFTEFEVERAAELLSQSTIKALWCFVLGGPEEDEATLGRTVGFINGKIGKKDCAFITTGLRIFPRTPLHDLAVTQCIVAPSEDLLMPRFYFSQKITPERARGLLQNNLVNPGRCIFLSDTQISSLHTYRRLGTLLRLPGPFWGYAGYMNRISSKGSIIRRNWSALPAVNK